MTSEAPIVRLTGVHKRYGDLHVLRGIDLEARRGETIALIGTSGSGKSTILRLTIGLEPVDEGEIQIGGEPLWPDPPDARHTARVRGRIGMVFQQYNLFPHMTVLDNLLAAPVLAHGQSRDEVRPRARELLERVGMSAKAEAYPIQLSGGQRQRVAIARALTLEPDVMLFDEVTSALDPERVGEVLDVMRELSRGDTTLMVVTHQMRFARQVADRVLFLDGGTIVEQGPADDVMGDPQEERTRAFLHAVLAD